MTDSHDAGLLPGFGRRIRLAVIANEFFERSVGRIGGFGWAASRVATCFAQRPELGVDVVLVSGLRNGTGPADVQVRGARLLRATDGWGPHLKRVRSEQFDLVLTIDYRPRYRELLGALRGVPVIVWIRDPRNSEDGAKISTLRLPSGNTKPAGGSAIDCASLGSLMRRRLISGRRTLLAAVDVDYAADRYREAYGLRDDAKLHALPNPVELQEPGRPGDRPSVLYLGRHDPIKRPWLFVELAQRFPGVEFLMAGDLQIGRSGTWKPASVPPNLRTLGHVEGEVKHGLLGTALVLVNTTIHEAIAVSFLEALSFGVPILSFQDPIGLVSRFGHYVGRWDGDGVEGLPALESGLRRLMDDGERRRRLGADGREWVRSHHSVESFLAAFRDLAALALGRSTGPEGGR